jgi:ABC-type glutathione transport system ATPase component
MPNVPHSLYEAELVEYVNFLEEKLRDKGEEIPEALKSSILRHSHVHLTKHYHPVGVMQTASPEELEKLFQRLKSLSREFEVNIQYKDLGYWTEVPENSKLTTIASTLKEMVLGAGPKTRVDILKSATGRILQGKMTLVLGPPGSGKSVFLKALSGRLRTGRSVGIRDGDITYNGASITSGQYLLPKIADYVEQTDSHLPTLTVEETLGRAFKTYNILSFLSY